MALDPQLLEILACPDDKGPLLYFEDEDSLYNPRLKRRYAIKDDIPIMLIDEAETVDDAEHERLLAKAERPGHRAHLRRVAEAPRCPVCSTRSACSTWPPRSPSRSRRPPTLGAEVDGLPEREAIEHVVVLGMGGSGIAGDVLAAVAGPFMPVPVIVAKGYEAPASVGEGTLCFAISYSGDTEETVEAAQAAAVAGARMVVLSTGGELARLAAAWDAPHVVAARLPDAAGRHRLGEHPAARRSSSGSGCSRAPREYVADAVRQLQRRRDKLIVDGGPGAAAGPRHRAHHADRLRRRRARRRGGLPLQVPGERERQGAGVLRRAARDGPQRDLRLGPARRHHPPGDDRGAVPPRLRAPAGGPPVRPHLRHHRRGRARASSTSRPRARAPSPSCFDLVIQGDFVSLHLAAEAGVDPGPIPVLTDLKAALAE